MAKLPEPTFEGFMGRAWRIPRPESADGRLPESVAAIETFLIESEHYHPAWSRWMLNVCHLRDVPGQSKPPYKRSPDMTHEFQISSLNPDFYARQDAVFPDLGGVLGFLDPPDVIEQFVASADQIAARICELAARSIVDGLNSPDQDYRQRWHDTIQQTAARFREGKHGIA